MRIVSLAPSNTEILFALGAGEQVVATTSLCDYPAEARNLPGVGGWSEGLDIDKVVELDPDVAMASDELQDDIVEKLAERGVNILQFTPHEMADVFDSITTTGELLGRKDRAEELIQKMKEDLGSISLPGTRIYCEEWSEPPMVSGNWIPGLIEGIGGEYFIEEGERSREFSLENLKQSDPEHIFLNICGAGDNVDPQEVLERECWQDISAVNDGNIHVIDDALLNRPGPRLVKGAEEIKKLIDQEST